MPRAISPVRVELTADEREELVSLARAQAAPHRAVVRAKVILSLADGRSVRGTAHDLGVKRDAVTRWGKRFVKKRLRGLDDLARSGRPARFPPGDRDAAGQARVRAA
jgi:hypothetical protein